jgi:soluble lytic murein transglycosylase-like protein
MSTTIELVKDESEVSIESIDIPIVASAYMDRIAITDADPYSYHVDIQDGYITEDSLHSCAVYVGNQKDIDPVLLMAFAKTESNYKVNAVGADGDSGLCQIIPKWYQENISRLGVTDIFDPVQNLTLCADILTNLQSDSYGYDRRYVAMAYNMGQAKAKSLYSQGIISDYANRIDENYDILRRQYE